MNGATYNDEVNAFNCTCADGYEGVNCKNGTIHYPMNNLVKNWYIKETYGNQSSNPVKELITLM